MLPHPCRESAADKFSFSDSTDTAIPEGPSPSPGAAMEYGKWAERIKGKYNYFGRPEDVKFGAWSRKSSVGDRDRSGTPSPELWKAAGKPPAAAARSAEISPAGSRRFDEEEDRRISNGSRASSIAMYRQEMLDLVRDMPENSYELSLIDIVESPKVTEPKVTETTKAEEEEEEEKSKEKKKKKKGGIMRRVSRSESLDSGGLMLKMFIPRMPVVLGGKRQQALIKSGKVSPTSKPSSVDGEGDRGSTEFGERASSTSSRNSNSSSSTTTTSSSSRNSTNSRGSSVSSRLIGSCYPFAHRGKSMGVDD